MKKTVLSFFLLILSISNLFTKQDDFPKLTGPYLGQKSPGMTPELFAPEVITIPVHSAVVFSPDGLEVFYVPWSTLKMEMMKQIEGNWTKPKTVSFATKYDTENPCFTEDGGRMYFTSTRPIKTERVNIEEKFWRENIWYVDREKEGWSEPVPLSSDVNSFDLHWEISINDLNKDLYFSASSRKMGGRSDIYKSAFVNGEYVPTEKLSRDVNTEVDEDNINDFIKIEKIKDKVIMVKMGFDAVIAIETQKGIVVIDAGISNSLTAFYRKAIKKEFGRNDFAYLINTHSHSDHIGGNQVFSDAVIIGHENCVKEISESWADLENKKSRLLKIANEYKNKLKTLKSSSNDWEENYCQLIRYKHAYEDLLNDRVITYPEITFADRLNISMGDVSLDLIYFGKAHSGSDILIHIPEVKLLMIGDLFSPGGIPAIGNVNKKDAERWLYVVQWLKDRWDKIDKVISGHGQIMNRNDLQSFNEYVEKKYEELE